MDERKSGILLHISSLPSRFGIGDLGPEAYRFVDFLAEAEQRIWQILPLNPTDTISGNSPYNSPSAFASNPLFISPELLVRDGLLEEIDLRSAAVAPSNRVDYESATLVKKRLLERAYQRFKSRPDAPAFGKFKKENANWLEDYALFTAVKEKFQGRIWSEWEEDIAGRQPEALEKARNELIDPIEEIKFLQYLFFNQWNELKAYCEGKDIQLFGDIPIYVVYDSVDVWTNPELFKLDEKRQPYAVAGVPPDYFSETGQLWGNPVYRWDILRKMDYAWWDQRIAHNLSLFNLVRIDHFRGMVSFWEVPAGEKTAIKGRWVDVPIHDFLNRLLKKHPRLPIIAEDLGLITQDVRDVMEDFSLPGMKVLMFAFGDDMPKNLYIPHNLPRKCILYTGTHDNNTARGWFEDEISKEIRQNLFDYIGREVSAPEVSGLLVRLAMMSVADTVIFPAQDILGLDGSNRMNKPGTSSGNWSWRLLPGQLTPDVAGELKHLSFLYNRIQR